MSRADNLLSQLRYQRETMNMEGVEVPMRPDLPDVGSAADELCELAALLWIDRNIRKDNRQPARIAEKLDRVRQSLLDPEVRHYMESRLTPSQLSAFDAFALKGLGFADEAGALTQSYERPHLQPSEIAQRVDEIFCRHGLPVRSTPGGLFVSTLNALGSHAGIAMNAEITAREIAKINA